MNPRLEKEVDPMGDFLNKIKQMWNTPDDEYDYDDNGNTTSITRNNTVAFSYDYNGTNELIRENNGFTQSHDYRD